MSVDKSQQRIRRMFGAIAPRYDRMNRLMTFGLDRRWRNRTVRSVPTNPAEPVLDVCCGTGDLALAWASRLGPDARVVGSDFTHPMLVRAREKSGTAADLAEEGRVVYVEGDTLKLPCPDDRFQVVSVGFGIRNVGDTVGGLAEMTRVCRPGGHVVVLETSVPRLPVVGGLFRFYFNHVVPLVGRWVAPDPDAAYSYLPASTAEFPQGESFAELMRSAGLEEIVIRPLTLGSVTLYVGRKPG
jgi:demethylmenaquinone methyltransferase/2-methoxy-6-polyprenyl-1,4-benzoquinol methylase